MQEQNINKIDDMGLTVTSMRTIGQESSVMDVDIRTWRRISIQGYLRSQRHEGHANKTTLVHYKPKWTSSLNSFLSNAIRTRSSDSLAGDFGFSATLTGSGLPTFSGLAVADKPFFNLSATSSSATEVVLLTFAMVSTNLFPSNTGNFPPHFPLGLLRALGLILPSTRWNPLLDFSFGDLRPEWNASSGVANAFLAAQEEMPDRPESITTQRTVFTARPLLSAINCNVVSNCVKPSRCRPCGKTLAKMQPMSAAFRSLPLR